MITTRVAATRPGIATNTVRLFTAQGLKLPDSQQTEWLAVPGVTVSITDSKDPIRVGESATHSIRVRNQGDFEPVSGAVTLRFKDNLVPTSVEGDARGLIDGQVVTFPRTTWNQAKISTCE